MSTKVFGYVLKRLALVMAPFTPFISELVFQNLDPDSSSIHLEFWPSVDQDNIDTILEEQMNTVRQIVEKVHATRQQAGIELKQPLSSVQIKIFTKTPIDQNDQLIAILKDEINIKQVVIEYASDQTDLKEVQVVLDTNITPELKAEGKARSLVRQIQQQRKSLNIGLDQKITTTLPDWPESFTDYIKQKTLSTRLVKGKVLSIKTL
ncbi:MAG: isoleucyl-tRNA synthetase [uncultured bacterium]|nr:MAG: isoleucyl-tRNA synthetase [uncultured bacterium]